MQHSNTNNWKSTAKTSIFIIFSSIFFSVAYIVCLIGDDVSIDKYDKLAYSYFGDLTISSAFGFGVQVVMPFYLCNFTTRLQSICLLLYCLGCDSTFRIIWFLFRLTIEAQPHIWRQVYLMIWALINDLNSLIAVPLFSYMSYHSQIDIDWILLLVYGITAIWFITQDEIDYFFGNRDYSPYSKLTMLVFLGIVVTSRFRYRYIHSRQNLLYQKVLFDNIQANDPHGHSLQSNDHSNTINSRLLTTDAQSTANKKNVKNAHDMSDRSNLNKTTILCAHGRGQNINHHSCNNVTYNSNVNCRDTDASNGSLKSSSQIKSGQKHRPNKNTNVNPHIVAASQQSASTNGVERNNSNSEINFLCVCYFVIVQELFIDCATLVEILDSDFNDYVVFSHDITSLIIYTGFIIFYWIEFFVASMLLKKIKVDGIPKYELLFPLIYFNDLFLTLYISFNINITWLFYFETVIKIIFKWILWHPRMLYFYDHYVPKLIKPMTNKFRLAIQFFYNIFASIFVFIISLTILWIDFLFSTKVHGKYVGWMLQFDQTLSNTLYVTKNIFILFAIETVSFVLLFCVLKIEKKQTSQVGDSNHENQTYYDSDNSLDVNQSTNVTSETSISKVDRELTVENGKIYVITSLNKEIVYFSCAVTMVTVSCIFFIIDNVAFNFT